MFFVLFELAQTDVNIPYSLLFYLCGIFFVSLSASVYLVLNSHKRVQVAGQLAGLVGGFYFGDGHFNVFLLR